MKRIYRIVCIVTIIFMFTACSKNYKVLNPLGKGSLQIEYKGVVYIETDCFYGKPSGKKVFLLYGDEIDSGVPYYHVYLDGNTMYLKAWQSIFEDATPINFVLTAEGAANGVVSTPK